MVGASIVQNTSTRHVSSHLLIVVLLATVHASLAVRSADERGVSHNHSDVEHVSSAHFNPLDFDAVVDVRNEDEYVGKTNSTACSIGADDPRGCLYGHIPGAIWMPQMHLCGTTVPGTKCREAVQILADAGVLSGIRLPSSEQLPAYAPFLKDCQALRVAFVCHSGVRSLSAAKLYAAMLERLYPGDTAKPYVVASVDGGTQGWVRAGRKADFSTAPGGPRTCEQMKKAQQRSTELVYGQNAEHIAVVSGILLSVCCLLSLCLWACYPRGVLGRMQSPDALQASFTSNHVEITGERIPD